MVLASAVEPLRAACHLADRPLFQWRVATQDGGPVRSSSDLTLQADKAVGEGGQIDALVVVAGYGARRLVSSQALSRVRRAARRAERVIGLDMGPWLMAAAGLLEGRRATVHWQEVDAFREEFLNVDLRPERLVRDRNMITAGDAKATMDMALELIRERGSEALAFDVMRLFLDEAGWHAVTPGQEREALSRFDRALRLMRETVETPLTLGDVARKTAMSERSLERMFRRELGLSAGSYYRGIRLSLAQNLVRETGLPASAIAARTGFSSSATLARAYRAQFGQTMGSARRDWNRGKAKAGGADRTGAS